MWIWITGIILTAGGIAGARGFLETGENMGIVMAWGFMALAVIGAGFLVYKASTQGLI